MDVEFNAGDIDSIETSEGTTVISFSGNVCVMPMSSANYLTEFGNRGIALESENETLKREVEHQRAEIDRLRDVEAEARDWNRRYVELSTNIRSALRNVERDFL